MTSTGIADIASSEAFFTYVKPAGWQPSWGGVPVDPRFGSTTWEAAFRAGIPDTIGVKETHVFDKPRRFVVVDTDDVEPIQIGHLRSVTLVQSGDAPDGPFEDYPVWWQYDLGLNKPLDWTVGYRDAGGSMRNCSFFEVVGGEDASDETILKLFGDFHATFCAIATLDVPIDPYGDPFSVEWVVDDGSKMFGTW